MRKLHYKRHINKIANLGWKSVSFISAIFAVFIMFLIIIFMIIQVDPVAKHQNIFSDIIFSSKYSVVDGKFGLAIPILMTIITTICSLLVAVPLSIKCAVFIVFRIKKPGIKKILRGVMDLLAGIPSIVFGMFSLTVFGEFLRDVFSMQSSRNLLTAFLTLSFMIMPMIIALAINALEAAKQKHWDAAIVLGCSTSSVIYKIIKPAAKKGIVVGIIVATTRALGESMALSIILQGTASSYNSIGIAGFFNNSTPTLAALTARDFLGGDASAEILPSLRGAFFAGGVAFFIMVFLLNVFILGYTKESSWKGRILNKVKTQGVNIKSNFGKSNRLLKLELSKGRAAFIPTPSFSLSSKNALTNGGNQKKHEPLTFHDQLTSYIKMNQRHDILRKFYHYYKQFLEFSSIGVVFAFIFWIIIDTIFIKGSAVFNQAGYIFGTANSDIVGNSIGATIVSTLLLIIVVLVLALPIALFIAIYMKEYSKRNSKWVHIARFFIDALGSTPSIFFGIFGLVFFIETLNVYNPDQSFPSPSIMAGSLTMMIVVLPTLIRSLEAALDNVPTDYKYAAIALGVPKWKVIYKIIVPSAIIGISTSIILTVGRIMSETAPIYLTMGLSANRPWYPDSNKTLLESGQTLTSRIYANIAFSSNENDYLKAYEAAFFCVLLIIILNFLSYYLSNYISKKMGLK